MCSFTFFKVLLPSQLGLLSTLFKTEALRTLLPVFSALYFSQLINAIILFFICVAYVICLYARSLIICAWMHFDVPNKAQVASKHLINIYIINKLWIITPGWKGKKHVAKKRVLLLWIEEAGSNILDVLEQACFSFWIQRLGGIPGE